MSNSSSSSAAPAPSQQTGEWTTVAEINHLWRILFSKKSDFVLRVTAPSETVFLRFAEGNLVEATSTHAPAGQRLGEILVGLGMLRREALDQFLSNASEERGRIGDALVRGGLVTQEQLQAALRHQAATILARLENAPTLHLMVGA